MAYGTEFCEGVFVAYVHPPDGMRVVRKLEHVNASWGRSALLFSADGRVLFGCGKTPGGPECVWARHVAGDSSDEAAHTGRLDTLTRQCTDYSIPAMGDPTHVCFSDPPEDDDAPPQLMAVCVRLGPQFGARETKKNSSHVPAISETNF